MNIVKVFELNKKTTCVNANLIFRGHLSDEEVIHKLEKILMFKTLEFGIEVIYHEDEHGNIVNTLYG